MTSSAKRCPLCGRDNQCGMAAGAPSCWCTKATIPPEVLQAIPESAQGKVCVCPSCARGEALSPCIDVCEVDHRSQSCRGCGRTLQEIASWSSYSIAEKRAVLRRLAARSG